LDEIKRVLEINLDEFKKFDPTVSILENQQMFQDLLFFIHQ
tara:strand:+ start:1113 stop:1235 length:123 start_codon:yes stop_codon:yes gene_type:complete